MRRSIKRQKAFLGESIAAAGISAAATLAAAAIGAKATAKSGEQQAQAAREAAQRQAEALRKQNENANILQQQSIEFTRQQNDLNRELQKDAQMNIQLAMARRTTDEAKNQARIQVKKGGSTRRKLKNIGISAQPFYGGAGLFPFKVKDGGFPLPIEYDGYGQLYELIGDNHEQSHEVPTNNSNKNKAAKGTRATGIGFEFANGQEIEGEGNGNSNLGELLYVTPSDAYFISKHSIGGYNPAKDVLAGEHPMLAFNKQEAIKNGKLARRKMYELGGDVIPKTGIMFDQGTDLLNTDDTVLALSQLKQNGLSGRRSAKKGGRIKADNGFGTGSLLWGAGINTVGNLGGAFISMFGNNRAAKRISKAYNEAGNILSNAYGNLQTIDDKILDKSNFQATHVMPVLQSTVVQNTADREALARELRRSKERINNTTLSGAARQNRLAAMSDAYQQGLAQISQAENKEMRTREAANMEAANNAAIKNAELDSQANKDYTASRLALAQYNNDIVNERIMGQAQAQADAISGGAQARATAMQSNAQALGSAIASSGNAFSTALMQDSVNRTNYQKILAGLDSENKVQSIITMGDSKSARAFYDMWKDSTNQNQRDWANQLNDVFKFNPYRVAPLPASTSNGTQQAFVFNPRMSLRIGNPSNSFLDSKYMNSYVMGSPFTLQNVVPRTITTPISDQQLNTYYGNLYINRR